MSDIVQRLEASIRYGCFHGDTHERVVCQRQAVEAVAEINRLRTKLEAARAEVENLRREALMSNLDRIRPILDRIIAAAGNPDPAEACRVIIKLAKGGDA